MTNMKADSELLGVMEVLRELRTRVGQLEADLAARRYWHGVLMTLVFIILVGMMVSHCG